jgi:hypothetical protein
MAAYHIDTIWGARLSGPDESKLIVALQSLGWAERCSSQHLGSKRCCVKALRSIEDKGPDMSDEVAQSASETPVLQGRHTEMTQQD